MSKRAEKRGLEALPPRWRKTRDGKGKVDGVLPVRKFYIRAYKQAEKDALERAIEWWRLRLCGFLKEGLTEGVLGEFRRAMEDEL